MLREINKKVVSYCEMPESLTDGHWISDLSPDVYTEYRITHREVRDQYDDDFGIDDWLLLTYPELENERSILIHIDY